MGKNGMCVVLAFLVSMVFIRGLIESAARHYLKLCSGVNYGRLIEYRVSYAIFFPHWAIFYRWMMKPIALHHIYYYYCYNQLLICPFYFNLCKVIESNLLSASNCLKQQCNTLYYINKMKRKRRQLVVGWDIKLDRWHYIEYKWVIYNTIKARGFCIQCIKGIWETRRDLVVN